MSKALTCGICRRRKPVGIMTAQGWGVIKGDSLVAHACPDCQQKHLDWRAQLTRLANGSS